MLTEQRHEIILNLLSEKGSITVTELKELLNTSESTIRRDLNTLDEQGRLTKVFGGAVEKSNGVLTTELSVSQKATVNTEAKKKIAYIPDNPDLYENMKAIDFINFICDMYEVSEDIRRENTLKYAKMFEIEDKLNDDISSFSHGMKQKLAIISALIHEPKLYILDEPFVGLDPKATHLLKEIMKEKCKEGCAFFFSTHILEVAEKLCNKIAIIKEGKIVISGEMKKIVKDKSLEDIFLELVNE